MSGRARMGFRARLTALIAGVFIAGSAALLVTQFLLVQHLLEAQVDETVAMVPVEQDDADAIPVHPAGGTCPDGTNGERRWIDEVFWIDCMTSDGRVVARVLARPGPGATVEPRSTAQADLLPPVQQDDLVREIVQETTTRTTTAVRADVLHDLLLWSIAVLAASAGLAVLAAWWLSKRSLGRIARITAAARAIDPHDLHHRLALPGPVDEIKELGDTIDSMLDRIEDAFTRQDRFIAGASHELRTPLTTTRTLLEIPLAQGMVPPELEPDLREALAANRRSEQLVAALLTLARSRHGAGEGTPCDLAALVRRLLAAREEAIAARGLTVSVSDGGGAGVVADEGLLLLAVGNLLDNAVRHNADGGTLRVATGAAVRGAWIEIGNDGADLTATDVAALTEPFHRGTASRLAGEGLGLGLALVETATRALGGTLRLAARPHGGLTVRLTLPLA